MRAAATRSGPPEGGILSYHCPETGPRGILAPSFQHKGNAMNATLRPIVFHVLAAASLAAVSAAAADIQPGDSPSATWQAIQTAIDAAANASPAGTVTLGEGTFRINAQLMVTGGVTVAGQGWTKTTIQQTTAGATARCATVSGGARLEGVTLTGGRLTEGWKHGAGVDLDGGTVSWCRITDNQCTARNSYGGGVHVNKGTIDHCIVDSNQAGTYTSGGGGIGTFSTFGPVVIDTCLVYGNTASVTEGDSSWSGGGGLGFFQSIPVVTIRNTTVVGNSAKGLGGGLRTVGNKVKLVNCIITGNEAETGDEISGDLANDSSHNFIGVDPRFADAANGDYRLDPRSLAIFAGAAREDGGTDLDGTAFASTPSLGCYEFTGTPTVNDPVFPYGTNVTFTPSVAVPLTCPNEGASIYYTLDGTEPTDAAATLYTEPIGLSATTTIKARAYKAGLNPSDAVTATYALGTAKPPVLGEVTVSPRSTSVAVSGEILSVGNNLATSCGVYFSYGTRQSRLGPETLVASGATDSFSFVVPGLDPETTYYYAISVSNDAQTAMFAAARGSFETTAEQALSPGETPAETRQAIQEAIDLAVPLTGTVVLGAGVFDIDAQLMVTGGVTLVGLGRDRTVIRQTSAVSTTSNDQATRVLTIDGGATVKNLTLTGGKVTGGNNQQGGGALIKDGTISWCCITNNSVYGNNSKYGGGVGFYKGHGQVDHCIIADNLASSMFGTAVAGGGIGGYEPNGTFLVDTCLVYGNRAVYLDNKNAPHVGHGGGIGFDLNRQNSEVVVRNTTIAGNTAGGEGASEVSEGGGVYTTNDSKSKFSMFNCIVAGNTTVGTNTTVKLNYADDVDHCLFDVAEDKLGEHSKVGDPKFVKPARGNYRLSSGSPALGVATWYEGIPEDLDRARRLKFPAAGCYEVQFCTIMILR